MTVPPQPPLPGQGGFPDPRQNPYAQPVPNPYGQPPGAPQPHPYVQAPGQPQGQAPGQPYGGGWGAPPPPPPRGGNNKTLAIVIGSLVAVGAVLAGAIFLVGGDDKDEKDKRADGRPSAGASVSAESPGASPSPSESGATGGTYRLIVPKTLENAKYSLEQDLSDRFNENPPNDGVNTQDMKSSAGQYTHGVEDQLLYTGFTGRIVDPDKAVDDILDGMEEADGASVGQPRREITPEGSNEPLTCVVMAKDEQRKMAYPVCAWGDSTTLGVFMLRDMKLAVRSPGSIDLEAFAKRVAVMRDEVRKPA